MKRTHRWLLGGGAVLLLLLIALLLVPFFVSVDQFRPLIVRLAQSYTGRTVEIGGLRLYMLPSVHVEATDLDVKNPAGFPAGDTLAIKSVDLGTTIASLLARRVDVTGVTLNGVQVNLLQTGTGKTNYAVPGHLAARTSSSTGNEGGQGAPKFSLDRVGSITVQGVKITSGTYDERTGRVTPVFAVDGLNARVDAIRLGVPNWMDAVAITSNLGGLTFSSPFLSRPVEVQNGSLTITNGAAHATAAVASGTLRANAAVAVANLKNPVADVDLTIPTIDVGELKALMAGAPVNAAPAARAGPRRLLAKGRINVGKVVAPSVDASAATAQIAAYTDRTEISSYKVAVFGGIIQGSAALNYQTASPRVDATIGAQRLDLAGVFKALALPVGPGIAGAADADLHVDTTLGRDPLAAMTAAGTFTLRDGRFPGVSKPVGVQNGNFRIEHGGARVAFLASLGALSGRGTIAVANLRNPLVNFDLALPEVDLNAVSALVAGGRGSGGSSRPGGRERLIAKGQLRIARLIAHPVEANTVACSMAVYTDKMTVNSYRLSAYGGIAHGTTVLQYAAPNLPVQGTLQASGVDVGRLQAALSGGGRHITGTLEASGWLATTLTSDPRAALAGTGTFAVRNGSLPGLNLQQRFASMAKIAQNSGLTTFRYFGGDFRIARQRVYSGALKLDSANLTATGRGSAGFDQSLDYTGTGTMNGAALVSVNSQLSGLPFVGSLLGQYGSTVQSLAGYTVTVSFALKGTFNNPRFSATGIPQLSRSAAGSTQPSQQRPAPQPPQLPGFPTIKLPQLPF